MASTKRRPPKRSTREREDFNQAAFRIVQQATKEKPTGKKRSR